MDELLAQLSDAVASQNWLVVVAVSIVVVLGIVASVLKALGKSVPLLDSILGVAKSGVKLLPKKEAPSPAREEGIAAVVKVEDEKK